MVEVFYSITSSTQILKASPQNKRNTSPWNHNRSLIWQVMKYACNSVNFFFKGLNPLNQIKQLQQQYWWLHNGILGSEARRRESARSHWNDVFGEVVKQNESAAVFRKNVKNIL